MTRKSLLALFGALPLFAKVREAEPPAGPRPGEFDAKVWAESFVAHVKWKPEIATDEGTMIVWFANAIMAGYDRRELSLANLGSMENIRGALGRAYCTKENEHKILDVELMEAAAREIKQLF